ncbi:MAG TPA: hypothetical protein VGL26_10180 [Jatrophihabitans sp.]
MTSTPSDTPTSAHPASLRNVTRPSPPAMAMKANCGGVLEQSCETRHRRDTILLTIE